MSNATAHESTVTVRYQVSDIERSIAFYTERFGFRLGTRSGAAFADVTRGNLRLILSGPGSLAHERCQTVDRRNQVAGIELS